MRVWRVKELQWLLRPRSGPCISIYLPTHRYRPMNEQDPIRFRNLVHQAAALLRTTHPDQEVRRLLRPLEALAGNSFWQRQLDGLAVFLSPEGEVHYRLPARMPELVVVSTDFHTRPLVRYLYSNRRYYLLSLARKSVTVYEGTPYALRRIEVPELPAGLRDALGEEQLTQSIGSHSGAVGGGGPIYHAQGVLSDRKDETLRYFRAIDRAVWGFLRDERAPLVLAGVGYYHPIYREVNRYPHLLTQGVEGNVERASPEELHRKAWPLVAERFAAEERAALEAYGTAVAHGRASDRIPVVAEAVLQGRVRWLLHAEGEHVWGHIDPETGRTRIDQRQRDAEDADILDQLGEMTLLRGGDVLEVPPARMPTSSPVAAVYRY